MPSDQLEHTVGFLVSGRVQRVGFRWWTRRTASRLGLSGSVRNLADGDVEIQVCGPSTAIKQLKDLLLVGPPAAVVENIQTFSVEKPISKGFRLLP
jgi:acylphosphatase